ncbi:MULTISPECIES: hypothetical protein [unclassified Pseudomonas]|uniref:hypothetical protein n=1 Tax=unclassified Pseudomonas TaxID=196821 RepID=UPI0039B77756
MRFNQPITVEGTNYHAYFSTQSSAMQAAYEYFKNRAVQKFTIISFLWSKEAGDFYVVQDGKGKALALGV